jgi:hypothetical protein
MCGSSDDPERPDLDNARLDSEIIPLIKAARKAAAAPGPSNYRRVKKLLASGHSLRTAKAVAGRLAKKPRRPRGRPLKVSAERGMAIAARYDELRREQQNARIPRLLAKKSQFAAEAQALRARAKRGRTASRGYCLGVWMSENEAATALRRELKVAEREAARRNGGRLFVYVPKILQNIDCSVEMSPRAVQLPRPYGITRQLSKEFGITQVLVRLCWRRYGKKYKQLTNKDA